MSELQKPLLQETVLYRVKLPVRGITEDEHKAAIFPRGTLLDRLLPDESIRKPVRCYGRGYSVWEQELTQNCERVIARQRFG